MLIWLLTAILAFQSPSPVRRRPPEDLRLRGHWGGTIAVAGEPHEVTIRFSPRERPFLTFARRRLDGLIPLQPTSLTNTPTSFEAVFARPPFELSATLRPDNDSIDVVVKEKTGEQRAVFTRVDAPGFKRPQTPRPPFPYDTYDDRIDTGSGVLGLTLTLPKGKGPFPGVVLISGTGPQDRDNTYTGHRMFAVLADHLTRRGFAVLRYDDRGRGESSGLLGELRTPEADAFDAIAVFRYLREQPEVDRARTGFIGHSEGGVIASIAAGQTGGVAFLVFLASPALDGITLSVMQHELIERARGGSEERVQFERRVRQQIYDILRAEPDGAKARAAVAAVFRDVTRETSNPELLGWLAQFKKAMDFAVSERYSTTMRARMLMDPVPALRALRVPVLALFGDRDVQVSSSANEPSMRAAIAGSSPRSEVRILPGLNHGFQTAVTGGVEEYARIEETLAPAALEAITGWLTLYFLR